MNIGFDAKRYFNNQTGLGNYARFNIHALIQHAPENQYYLYHTSGKPPKPAQLVPPGKDQLTALWRIKGIQRQIFQKELDVYHGLSNELPMILWPKTTKKVVTIHDVIFKYFPETYSFIDRQIYDVKTKHAVSVADEVIAISENTKTDLIRFYGVEPEKISVIPIDVADHFYDVPRLKEEEHENQVLCVSSFTKRKNLARLIEAFHLVVDKVEYNLVIAGASGETLKNCQSLVKKLKLANRISLKPDLKKEALIQLYQKSLAMVYPSLYEGFGLPILESYRLGMPVASSNSSSMPEVTGNIGWLFNPEDVKDIAKSLTSIDIKAKFNPDFQKKIVEQLKPFNRETLVDQLLRIYQK